MYRITRGTTHHLPDAESFIATLNDLAQCFPSSSHPYFDPTGEVFVARAPGRLDVMGGIADYSGSLVLEMPLREATFVALQRESSRRLTIASLSQDSGQPLRFELSLDDLASVGQPVEYAVMCRRFQEDAAHHWAAYVVGVFLVLMRERGVHFDDGARLFIASQVPEGKGVSSSAALEVATMQAVAAAFNLALEPRDVALLCQKVENLVVGAPCGVMDQMTVACGEANGLLALLCQPAELGEAIAIPDDLRFWGIDSGVRHAVTGADYHSVRVGAFMGYRMIAERAGLLVKPIASNGVVEIADPQWQGYLANVTPSEFEQFFAAHLPERITGAEFLSRYQGTTDTVTRVAEDKTYAVRMPTAHPIYEHHRVQLFAELLRAEMTERRLVLLGELMYQSHASYSACGLGSTNTDRIVQLVREAGTKAGLYGAKITGGGSGGTVAVLAHREAGDAVSGVVRKYAQETGIRAQVFSGSSPGSASFGYLGLRAEKNP